MQEAIQVVRAPLATARSPVNSSTDSSQRGPSRTALPARSVEYLPPTSPRTRLARKRAASLDIDSANKHPRTTEDLDLDSASTPFPHTADPTQVCLCQPDPKIPRPRNAFILYRQHYQSQVVAQNPGLANPEISKIIGEQWRDQPPEVKSEWKRLAEEEKSRHQRQYPGYRYQPRRSAKGNGSRPPSSTAEDQVRCPKCNGRYISTPGTPMSPFTGGLNSAHPDRLQPPFTPSHPTEDSRPQYMTPMQNPRMETPRGPPQQMHHGMPRAYERERLTTHHEMDEDDLRIQSPGSDLKRRRGNQDAYVYNYEQHNRGYQQSPAPYSAGPRFTRNPSLPMSASYRQQRFPATPGMLARPGGTMGPPPQHSSMNQPPRHQYTPQSAKFDESLRLPPLQTQLPVSSGPASSLRTDPRNSIHDEQAKSVEAMVMTIPFVNKLKVLAKISPPLAPPGPTSPAVDTRGAMIALEGADQELLAEVGVFIEEHLRQDTTCVVKTWDGTAALTKERSNSSGDTEMTGSDDEQEPFSEYLNNIASWHHKSRQMIKHITTIPQAESEPSDVVKPKGLPIALVPGGFSLNFSNKYALKIPINDAYAPIDHWQWMATLWRGIIGPDLTIYIQRVSRDEMFGVEIRKDCPTIIVRVSEGTKMEERTSRRLAFEVMEFVRGFEPGKGQMAG